MGMEAFFIAMYDTPDVVHRLMGYLPTTPCACMRWAEAEGLLRVNNGNQTSFGSSYNFTTKLPAPGYTGARAAVRHVGLRQQPGDRRRLAAMFHEFCFPYYRDVCEPSACSTTAAASRPTRSGRTSAACRT